MMPPELVKLTAKYLTGPIPKSINSSIKEGLFP